MAVGDREKLVIDIVSSVLGVPAEDKKFSWFKNTHLLEDFGNQFSLIDSIFHTLGGNSLSNKGIRLLECDAYFGGDFNFIFEFDKFQHFSTARLKALNLYTASIQVSFDIQEYKRYCQRYSSEADKYRRTKTTKDFNFEGGRTAQRAYLDCFRDLLPPLHGLRPTVRVAEFEVADITGNNIHSRSIIKNILNKRLNKL